MSNLRCSYVTWLSFIWNMTSSHVQRTSIVSVALYHSFYSIAHDSFKHITVQLIQTCHRAPWLIHMTYFTHFYDIWLIQTYHRAPWLIHMTYFTHFYDVWLVQTYHRNVTWLSFIWDMLCSYVRRDSIVAVSLYDSFYSFFRRMTHSNISLFNFLRAVFIYISFYTHYIHLRMYTYDDIGHHTYIHTNIHIHTHACHLISQQYDMHMHTPCRTNQRDSVLS